MSRAALFPGQGAQFPGMGRELAARFPEARALFEKADAVLGFPLTHTLFEGSEEEVGRTDVCQPGIFLVSAATMAAAEARKGLGRGAFSCAAGLSLGEYTALWFAGALSFEDGLRLTRSLRQSCKRFEIRVDTAFSAVVDGCRDPRRDGGWISPAIKVAYERLHAAGEKAVRGPCTGLVAARCSAVWRFAAGQIVLVDDHTQMDGRDAAAQVCLAPSRGIMPPAEGRRPATIAAFRGARLAAISRHRPPRHRVRARAPAAD